MPLTPRINLKDANGENCFIDLTIEKRKLETCSALLLTGETSDKSGRSITVKATCVVGSPFEGRFIIINGPVTTKPGEIAGQLNSYFAEE
jgi:hypothetical protein